MTMTTQAATQAGAGWYPDPAGSGVRFWNGRRWSPLSGGVELLEAGPKGPLVVHHEDELDYSYRAVARLSQRPATAKLVNPR
jgi:hypothetical protein